MDPFVQQLASLCRAQVTRCKWVFVPTHAVGRTLGERIALEGTNWLNLRFVTPLDIALRMGAPFLVERGIEPSEEGLGAALMMRLLLDLPEKNGYFRPLADQPTMAQALWATVRELRMAGVKSADLKSEAFESPAKHAELRALLASYEQFLTSNNRGDMAVVYEEAVKHPDWCPIQPEDCWTELPDTIWTPLQRRVIDAMPGERIVPQALALPGASIPRRLAAGKVDRIQPEHDSAPLAFLLRPSGNWSIDNPSIVNHPISNPSNLQSAVANRQCPVTLFHAGGREAEIEEVFRRILAAGAPLDQVEIACASDAHVALVWEKALRHEWAVTLGPGIAAPSTRPGRALIALCDWIETDFAAGHLRRLLQSGDLEIQAEDQGFTASQAARTLGRAEAGWGRATYDLSLGLLRKSYETRASDPDLSDDDRAAAEAKATLTAKVTAWIAKLIASIPEPQAHPVASASLQTDPVASALPQTGRVASALPQTGRVASALPQTNPVVSAFRPHRSTGGPAVALPASARSATARPRRSSQSEVGAEEGRRKVPLQVVVDAALTFLEHSTSRVSQLDHRAATALGEYVVELRALGPFTCSLQEALRFIRERVESLSVAAERPRPGSLYACRLQQAGYSGRPHLFVVGLEEGRVFPAASEDPVLLDAERSGISPALKQSTDRIDEAVWSVLSRLAVVGDPAPAAQSLEVASKQEDRRSGDLKSQKRTSPELLTSCLRTSEPSVCLSYSTRDTREFRETYASWLMLQAFRLQQGTATASYQEMKVALGEPVSSVPLKREAAATESAWWLRTVVSTGDNGIEAVESSFAPLARGREAAGERDSERFTGFDGYVPDAGKVLDPCAAGNAFSVTELEGAAGCPYRFFLKRGLGLRALDEGERDKDVWLDPSTKGSELHAIYATVLRRCRDAGRRPDLEKDGAWLTKLAQGALDRLNREMPPATAEILARESADFLADVELFLEGECEPSSSEPIGFEVSFGRPLGKEEEALARAEPVEIDLGGGLTFRIAGRIDRIDKVGPSDFQVLDYKTGGFWRDDWHGTFKGGRRLQHALYGLAVVELLRGKYKKPKVTGAVYYHPSHKGRRERVQIAAPTPAQTAAVLADLREVIVNGAFVHAPDKDACKWCDYDGVCGADALGQAEGKLEDSKLKAFGRLAAHV